MHIIVAVKKPGEPICVKEVENDYKTFKSLLDDGLLTSFVFGKGIVAYCDDEGFDKRLPLNFILESTVIVGTVIFFRYDGGEVERSLTEEQIQLLKMFFSDSDLCVINRIRI